MLKKKRDALKSRFQALSALISGCSLLAEALLKDIVETKMKVGASLKALSRPRFLVNDEDGAFALAKAHYASSGDDISGSIIERV